MTDTAPTSSTSALHQAAQHLRDLTDSLLRLDSDSEVAQVMADQLEQVVRRVAPHVRAAEEMVPRGVVAPERFLDRSPVSGALNPIAPPVEFRFGRQGNATTTTTLGLAYQGPPGRVHGGWVATLLDHLMGCAAATVNTGFSYTRTLTVDYDEGVPLFEKLVVTGQVERVEGRKIWMIGDITVDGVVRARARGLWLSVQGEGAQQRTAARAAQWPTIVSPPSIPSA